MFLMFQQHLNTLQSVKSQLLMKRYIFKTYTYFRSYIGQNICTCFILSSEIDFVYFTNGLFWSLGSQWNL